MGSDQDPFLPQRTFAGLTPPYSDPEQARVAILPVPYEATTEWRGGTRHGPLAIIDASQYLELYDLESDREPYTVGIQTLPELEPVMSGPRDMVERVYQASRSVIAQGKFLAVLGGEHSISLGAVQAYKETFPGLSVLQLDAHADLRDEYLGTRYGQACVMRRVFELCPIVQAGIRSLSREEKQFIAENALTPVYMADLEPGHNAADRILPLLSEKVYLTIDVDVLDPSVMPAVGTPEPGGMGWQQLLDIVRPVAQHRQIVGMDLVEFCPAEGPGFCAYLLAKLLYKLIGQAVPGS